MGVTKKSSLPGEVTKKSGLPGEASMRTPLTGSSSSELPLSNGGSSSAVAFSGVVEGKEVSKNYKKLPPGFVPYKKSFGSHRKDTYYRRLNNDEIVNTDATPNLWDNPVVKARKHSSVARDFFALTYAVGLSADKKTRLKDARSVPDAWRIHAKECAEWQLALSKEGQPPAKKSRKQLQQLATDFSLVALEYDASSLLSLSPRLRGAFAQNTLIRGPAGPR